MTVSADAVTEVASLATAATERAAKLLELAERTTDEQTSVARVGRTRDVISLSKRLYLPLDTLTRKDSGPGPDFLDSLTPSLCHVLEQYNKSAV